MKAKVIVGYEWKDELKQYCNHTASVAIELVPDGEIDVAKIAELITPLRQLCQAKVYEAMQQGSFERAQADQQPDPVRERLNAPPPSNPRQQRPEPNRPYTQDEYDRERQYDEPRQQDRQPYRNGNGNGGGQQGGGAFRGTPKTGGQLFKWSKGVGSFEWIEHFGQQQGWPNRMADWHEDDVRWAYDEWTKKAGPQSVGGGQNGNGYRGNGR
jgi:hypothetical protein